MGLPCFKKKKKGSVNLEELKKGFSTDMHSIPLEELISKLNTDIKTGLTATEASALLAQNGPNSLTPPEKKSMLRLFAKNVFGGFNMLLWAAGILSFVGYAVESLTPGEEASQDNLFMGITFVFVVNVTGIFSFYMDRKSIILMDGFNNMIPPMAHVIRDGEEKDIPVSEVVVGDIVTIAGGDKVPADMRVIDARGLKVDNSSMTGESEPQSRNNQCTSPNPLETKNIALFSTNVVEGTAKGIVILTGDKTAMGTIAALTQSVGGEPTPIAKEIDRFVKISAIIALFVGIVFAVLAAVHGSTWIKSVIYFIGMVVANVPEGIVCTVTAVLTLTAKKMEKKQCLVKRLECVETLGSTSTICSDKTGTLTQNKMTVTHIWCNGMIDLTEVLPPGERKTGQRKHQMVGSYEALIRCASNCSRATIRKADSANPEFTGDASEQALMKYCDLVHEEGILSYREKFPKETEIPFNSTNKFQVSVHRDTKNNKYIVQMKGAPEKILTMCDTITLNGKNRPLNEEVKKDFQSAYEALGGYGERVFGFADLELDTTQFPEGFKFNSDPPNFPLKDLRFVGLLSMIDPPRPGVPHAVVMVTGDHPITARAIAEQVRIISEGEEVAEIVEDFPGFNGEDEKYGEGRLKKTRAVVVHGEQLKKMTPTTLTEILANYEDVVFARTSPAQKLQIVEGYQKLGQIVAVTGDGVNDAPALRKADIGIAMGIAGTDVSKQAADMILLDDDFSSIVTGVEEGRIIFDNLKKSISYVLTSNVPEITPFASYIIFGYPLPMSIVAILMIDLGTDLWPAISLAYEAAENDIMRRPPRDARFDRLVNHRLVVYAYLQIGSIQMCAGFCGYFANMSYHGFFPGTLFNIRDAWDDSAMMVVDSWGQEWTFEARKMLEKCCHGVFFISIVVVQWADLLVAKTRKNSIVTQGFSNNSLNFSIPFTACLAMLLMNTPGLNQTLGITRIHVDIIVMAIPFGLFIVLYDEIRCYFIRRYPTGWVYKETYY
ncbi:catp-4 [Pristionchus pacificus]|uniref:Sodium/potassium-transporting ATPase subunit alpha n=1 Tax=Pristionchus pacificus TaxID=54126 RepID=A0A2A6D3E5_PRIPA|nr:catp-4 [Pristionchus pacificus]|eukprot:PDM84919.1 catp-4 [Pristionchus pacificus]